MRPITAVMAMIRLALDSRVSMISPANSRADWGYFLSSLGKILLSKSFAISSGLWREFSDMPASI